MMIASVVTEDEARKHWCPFAHAVVTFGSETLAASRDPDISSTECNCLASECMAWRWVDEGPRPTGEIKAELGVWKDVTMKAPSRGYCGLAGSPYAATLRPS